MITLDWILIGVLTGTVFLGLAAIVYGFKKWSEEEGELNK